MELFVSRKRACESLGVKSLLNADTVSSTKEQKNKDKENQQGADCHWIPKSKSTRNEKRIKYFYIYIYAYIILHIGFE